MVEYNYPTPYMAELGGIWLHCGALRSLILLLGFDLASPLCGSKRSEWGNCNADQQRLVRYNE